MKNLKHYQHQAKLSRQRKEHERICSQAVERRLRPILNQSYDRYYDLLRPLARERMRLHKSILAREQAHPRLRQLATLQSFAKLIEKFAYPFAYQFDLDLE